MTHPAVDNKRVRVLIVDDSALMRKLLAEILSETGHIDVVGIASDGEDGVEAAARLLPDVITLDIQMPRVSGLEALPRLLAIRDFPVVMVSSLTQEGAEITLQALELGAVDFFPKPEKFQFSEMRLLAPLLVSKVMAAAQCKVKRSRAPRAAIAPKSKPPTVAAPLTGPVVVLGISTGGPQTLNAVLPLIVPPAPPILIVQHMPAKFTRVFAERLDRQSAITVREAEQGDMIQTNSAWIAPGGRHMRVAGPADQAFITLSDEPQVSGHKPSVDVLFQSAARLFESHAVGVIMTGMGRDGVDGCKAILDAGGQTYGQDEATSVVYGMNKAAWLEGAVKAQFAPEDLPAIIRLLGRRVSRSESPNAPRPRD